ncbi:MAG: hypothetical protein B5766_10580 [Candidatus Lumbricidophila eiseniae]|uniref:Penicillin-binding protein 2 n=1 Tax=Candidatus Lumbricidiphila eiseniae TaxID=1969409 RepID=A0A2A6FPU5_9MICO|nr:MAG: hypothetical protein B5766_10580 [Candidatus Lumbricidophila eiseniae]
MTQATRYPPSRAAIAVAALLCVVGVFAWKLVDVQVVRAAALNREAAAARSAPVTLYGARGQIVDANGVLLADSVMRYDIALSPKNASVPLKKTIADPARPGKQITTVVPLQQLTDELGAALGMPGQAVRDVISNALAANPDSDFAYVAKLVDTDVYERVRALNIPWVVPWKHPSRRYPDGAVAGNLIGFVGDDGQALAGLEYSQNSCLAGHDGEMTYEHSLEDWVQIPGTATTTKPAEDGGNLKLTVDSDLQWAVQRIAAQRVAETGASWATVTVMEVKTGKLLAVADVPTVDPNAPTATASADRGSRAFTAPYEPGSTFKAFTAASVVDNGKATPTSQVVAPFRYLPSNGANINDSDAHGDLRLTLTGVLIESSNTGMSKFGEKMADRDRYNYMKAFGLGAKTEVGFPGEEPGDLHGDPSDWDNQTKYTTMFGQGLTTTAVQIASVYQTIANAGVRMPVSLVSGCQRPGTAPTQAPVPTGERVITAESASSVSAMLESVYTRGWLAKQWNIPGYRIAAKTGTAQVPNGKGGYLKGYLVSVSGFAPADDPQYVVSVSIMDPVKLNTSAASAPVFRDVMSQVLKKYRVAPSGSPAPNLPATW